VGEVRPTGQSVYGEKFRIMLRMIPHPHGGDWTGTKMERATGGKVSTSYYSALRDGHIGVPRADKIEAIAKAMGFPAGLWFKSLTWWEEARENWERGHGRGAVLEEERREADGERFRMLIEHLFETRANEETKKPFTNGEVAASSGGVLTEEDVAAIRAGRLADPTWAQVLALGAVFAVDPSYWSGRDAASWRPSASLLEVAEGMDAFEIFQSSMKLGEDDRTMLRMLAERLRREPREYGPEERRD
jgi:transcriptional regulator with XRE-family HTH domain